MFANIILFTPLAIAWRRGMELCDETINQKSASDIALIIPDLIIRNKIIRVVPWRERGRAGPHYGDLITHRRTGDN